MLTLLPPQILQVLYLVNMFILEDVYNQHFKQIQESFVCTVYAELLSSINER